MLPAWLLAGAPGCGALDFDVFPKDSPAPIATVRLDVLDADIELSNPFQGWVAYARPEDARAPEPFDVVSVLVGWDELEPRPARFDWRPLERAIAREAGRTISARLYLMPDPYWGIAGRPDWSREQHPAVWCGDSDPDCRRGESSWGHPAYWDRALQADAERFLRAFAERFAGRIEYVDVRCYGIFGEWDASHDGAFPWHRLAPLGTSRRQTLTDWVDLYRRAFEGSGIALVINLPAYPEAEDGYLEESALSHALEAGFAIRYDAFRPGGPVGYVRRALTRFWATRFVVAEPGYRTFDPSTGDRVACGWCPWEAHEVLVEMLRQRANYASLGIEPRHWPQLGETHRELLSLARRSLGYRLAIRSLRHPTTLQAGRSFEIDSEWSNLGAGRLYRRATLRLALLDAAGRVAWTGEDRCPEFDASALVYGGPFDPLALDPAQGAERFRSTSCFELPPKIPEGRYSLRVSLSVGDRGIALANAGGDAERRLAVAEVSVRRPGFW